VQDPTPVAGRTAPAPRAGVSAITATAVPARTATPADLTFHLTLIEYASAQHVGTRVG
jgi:hypothetical protein